MERSLAIPHTSGRVELLLVHDNAVDLEAMLEEVAATTTNPPNWRELASRLSASIRSARSGKTSEV